MKNVGSLASEASGSCGVWVLEVPPTYDAGWFRSKEFRNLGLRGFQGLRGLGESRFRQRKPPGGPVLKDLRTYASEASRASEASLQPRKGARKADVFIRARKADVCLFRVIFAFVCNMVTVVSSRHP